MNDSLKNLVVEEKSRAMEQKEQNGLQRNLLERGRHHTCIFSFRDGNDKEKKNACDRKENIF